MTIRETGEGIFPDRSSGACGFPAIWQCTHSMGSDAVKGRGAGEHLVERGAEGIEIAAGIDRAIHPPGLLGRHIGERPGNGLGRVGRLPLAGQARREAEAGEPHLSAAEPAENAEPNVFSAISAHSAHSAVKRRQLPWNVEKSVAGTVSFIVFGSAAGVAFAWWVRPSIVPLPPLAFTFGAPLVAALVAAFVETIPIRLDDNISVPATAAAVMWIASVMTADAASAARSTVVAALPWAVGINVLTGWLGYRARTVSLSGAIGGAVIGAIIYAGGGAGAWVLLLATFLAAAVTSRLGLARKERLGIAEERGGRRGAGNAIANCGVAAIAAIAAVATPHHTAALTALVAALTAGGSDTVASEIGKAWGRSTFMVTTLKRVAPGTAGAMSMEGTAAGLLAAVALAAAGFALGLIPASAILIIVVAATAGALVESALGATLEGPGILNNDMLNFINTAVAAGVVLVLS